MSAAKKALDELDRLQASTDLNDDLPAINLALLLASPLAAVARAAAAFKDAHAAVYEPRKRDPRVELWMLQADMGIARNKLFAALDALEAAAREVTP